MLNLKVMKNDEDAITEIYAGAETSGLKGVYNSVDEALGPDLAERFARSQELNASEGLSNNDRVEVARLEKVWEGDVKLLRSEEGYRTFCLTTEGQDGLKEVAVVDFAGFVEEEGKLVPQYLVNNWVVQKMGSDGPCIDQIQDGGSLPPDVKVFYQPESTQPPEEAVESTKSGVCYYRNTTHRGGDKRIVTSSLTGALSVAHFEHECGHARDDAQLTDAERDVRREARTVAKRGIDLIVTENFDELETLEDRHRMDYGTARFLVAKEEFVATMSAKERLVAKREVLGINPDVEDRINTDFERAWETYDTYVAPPIYNASEAGRNLPVALVEAASAHAKNYDELVAFTKDLGLTDGNGAKMTIGENQATSETTSLPPGQYSVEARGRTIECNYYPSDLSQPVYSLHSSLSETDLDCYSRGDYRRLEGNSASICVTSPTDLMASNNVGVALEAERFFIGVIAEVLDARETEAIKRIEGLKTTFGPVIPSIEMLDPREQFREITEKGYPIQPLLEDEEKARTELMEASTRPIHRYAKLADGIAEKLEEDCFGNKEGYRFDPNTGQEVEGEEKLRVVCESVLTASGNTDKLPNWNTIADADEARLHLHQDTVAVIQQFSNQ